MTSLDSSESTKVISVVALISLFLSGWTFLNSLDDDRSVRDVERRLACLELPGPNDCGVDGR